MPNMLEQLTQPRTLVALVLAVMLLEWLALSLINKKISAQLAVMLAAGAFLLLAMLAALHQVAWPIVAGLLALGGVAHLLDLRQRLPQWKASWKGSEK